MEQLPVFASILFIIITVLAAVIFYYASGKNKIAIAILIGWVIIQSIVGLSGFFTVTDTIPPRFPLLIIPPFLAIILLFVTSKGKMFIDTIEIKYLPLLHSLRIGVEIVLYWLFLYKLMPQLMTFEGRNFDIISGLTAPVVYFLGSRGRLSNRFLLYWNIACFAILIFTVTNGILSVPSIVQQFAFDQPNTAVLYFPFILLPGLIVPLVLFSHLAAIRQLIVNRKSYAIPGPNLANRNVEIV